MYEPIGYRPDLQGVRALAVSLVLVAHSGLGLLPGGFVGVDVFFVLSGYLITGQLLTEYSRHGHIRVAAFYARRLKRLLPALLLVILVTFALSFWWLSSTEIRAQLGAAPYAAAWASNLYFAFHRIDYFDELSGKDLFLHTWSLGVEEQFYLVWPALLLALLFAARRWRTRPFSLLSLFLVVAVASFALSLWLLAIDSRLAFYLMPSRIWQFSLGAMVYVVCALRSAREPRYAPWSAGLLALGLALIIGSSAWIDPNQRYPGIAALFPSLGAVLLIYAGRHAGSWLRSPPAVWLGDRSYSLYLWHWPVFILGGKLAEQPDWRHVSGWILLSVLLSAVSYRWVELPFWKGRFSRFADQVIFLTALLSILVVLMLTHYGLRNIPLSEADIAARKLRADTPPIYPMGCDTWYRDADVKPCIIGNPEAGKTVAFIGDSVGAQWYSLLPALFPEPEWKIVFLTKSACPIVDETVYYRQVGGDYTVCDEWRDAAITYLADLAPDVLLIGSASTYRFSEEQWTQGVARLLDRLAPSVGSGLLIPGTPTLSFDAPSCARRQLAEHGAIRPGSCEATNRMQQADEVASYLSQVAERFSNFELLRLNDLVCPNRICSAVNPDGILVFRDSQHLTDSFVRSQVGEAAQRLNAAMASMARKRDKEE